MYTKEISHKKVLSSCLNCMGGGSIFAPPPHTIKDRFTPIGLWLRDMFKKMKIRILFVISWFRLPGVEPFILV